MTPHPLEDPALRERIRRVAKRLQANRVMRDHDVDDLAHDITAVVLRRLQRFDPARATLEGFVDVAARSAGRSLLRDAKRAKRDPRRVRSLTEKSAGPLLAVADTSAERREQGRRILAALDRLSEDDRAIALDLMRLGAHRARERSGLDRSQWVQTKDRIWLTVLRALVEE